MNSSTLPRPFTLANAGITALLTQIAASLPAPGGKAWSVKPYDSEHVGQAESRGYLVRSDGLSLWVHAGGYGQKGRITFSLNRPHDEGANDGGYVTIYRSGSAGRVADPSITAADTKDADQLAADIARRLLKDAEEVHALVMVQINAHAAHRAARLGTAQRIADALGLPMPEASHHNRDRDLSFSLNRSTDNWDRGYGDAKVSGDTVSFELRSIPADKAIEIAAWLRVNVFADTGSALDPFPPFCRVT